MKPFRIFISNFIRCCAVLFFCLACVTPGTGKTDPAKIDPGKGGTVDPGKKDPGKTDPGRTDPPSVVTFHPGGIVLPTEKRGTSGVRKVGVVFEPGRDPWPKYRFITSRRGLNMRNAPALDGRKIMIIPYNTRVHLLHTGKQILNIGGKGGSWARIRFGDTIGWVFDAYLSETRGPDILDAAGVRALYRAMPFRARLVSGDPGVGRVIGRLRKKGGSERLKVDTLRRTCGRGKLDGAPEFKADGMHFFIQYRWCKVDPGNEVRVSCVNCDMYRYECVLPATALNEHTRAGGGKFEKPISCKVTVKSFCAKDCPL